MNKQAMYQKLEDKMLGYADLVGVSVKPVDEQLVPISKNSRLDANPVNTDMESFTGKRIFVRQNVLARLERAAQLLAAYDADLQLQVVYGYRTLSIQQKLFNKFKQSLEAEFIGPELLEATHRLIAAPDIAGHPTGGAVDIQIIKDGAPIEMGTNIWEFTKDSFTFSPFVRDEAQQNRQILREVMMKAGFAPFDGEWWHFSYGDKEWAAYYKRPYAIYGQVEFRNHQVRNGKR